MRNPENTRVFNKFFLKNDSLNAISVRDSNFKTIYKIIEILFDCYLINIKALIIAIKRFSIKLMIPKGIFVYPPTHAQFNFNLSK